MPRNVEIKARIESVAALAVRAAAIADTGPVEIVQDDTFFACGAGRLKLRQFADVAAVQMKAKRPVEAEEAFRRSIQLAGDNPSAGLELFDLLYDQRRLDEAAAVLDELAGTNAGEYATARRIRLAASRHDRKAARREFEEIAQMQSEASWPLDAAIRAMVSVGWKRDVRRIVDSCTRSEQPSGRVLTYWARECAGRTGICSTAVRSA